MPSEASQSWPYHTVADMADTLCPLKSFGQVRIVVTTDESCLLDETHSMDGVKSSLSVSRTVETGSSIYRASSSGYLVAISDKKAPVYSVGLA